MLVTDDSFSWGAVTALPDRWRMVFVWLLHPVQLHLLRLGFGFRAILLVIVVVGTVVDCNHTTALLLPLAHPRSHRVGVMDPERYPDVQRLCRWGFSSPSTVGGTLCRRRRRHRELFGAKKKGQYKDVLRAVVDPAGSRNMFVDSRRSGE